MAESQSEVAYEVRVLQGDTWQIHARYSSTKQRTAVEDAKSLEKISTIKVVKESYSQATGLSNEFDIYRSASLIAEQEHEAKEKRAQQPAAAKRKARPEAKPKKPTKAAKPKPPRKKEPRPRPEKENRTKKKSLFAGIIKLLLVVMVGLVLATLVMQLAELFLDPNRALGARISANTRANVLIGVFLATFFLSAFSMVSAFIKKGDLDISLERRRPHAARPPKPVEAPKQVEPIEEEEDVEADD